MATQMRWRNAQQYERGFWEGVARRIAGGSEEKMKWYEWRAQYLAQQLRDLGLNAAADGQARVLEVGCGPIGVISFYPGRSRVAVDPLEDYYGANSVLTELRDPAVEYRQGVGEQLPVEDAAADLVVIENCIDHVRDVHGVVRELTRVLDRDGILYLTVNCRSALGYRMHRILSRLRIDAGHPHTFTPARAVKLIEQHGLEVLKVHSGSYMEALRHDLSSGGLRGKIKALLGVSEYVVTVIARRSGQADE